MSADQWAYSLPITGIWQKQGTILPGSFLTEVITIEPYTGAALQYDPNGKESLPGNFRSRNGNRLFHIATLVAQLGTAAQSPPSAPLRPDLDWHRSATDVCTAEAVGKRPVEGKRGRRFGLRPRLRFPQAFITDRLRRR